MTIIATTETRNSAWANDKSAFGRKMLVKMGWKGGDAGLGKDQQGGSVNLRAIRRAEMLGIGAESDLHGGSGWSQTNAAFSGVLASLGKEHGGAGADDADDDGAAGKKRRKEERKRKKKEEKRRERREARGDGGDGSAGGGGGRVRLPQNKVQAGHARKMREAKDIRSKSAADMAAIFGVKADFYKQPREWMETSGDAEDGAASATSAGEKKKENGSKKKSKELKENEDVDDKQSKKDKKKRKRSTEGSDSNDRKKSKKKKDKSKK